MVTKWRESKWQYSEPEFVFVFNHNHVTFLWHIIVDILLTQISWVVTTVLSGFMGKREYICTFLQCIGSKYRFEYVTCAIFLAFHFFPKYKLLLSQMWLERGRAELQRLLLHVFFHDGEEWINQIINKWYISRKPRFGERSRDEINFL